MWTLVQISALNICSFRELEYTPPQGVTTLIFGHNADNENQKSNGSGKSTLIEAIAFGITGSPLRKIRNEELINDNAEECYVQLRFRNGGSGEMLIVEREISRKGASVIHCTVRHEGEKKEVVQPSVDAYNKYILDKLGITRDELFSSFILSKHRYQDFLSASDNDKKQIINKFSNGDLVDKAIEKIEVDLKPVRESLKEADLEFAGIEGRIEMLAEQIRNEEDSRQEKERSRQEKIEGIRSTIAQKRNLIRDCEAGIEDQKSISETVDGIDRELQKLENSDAPLGECMASVKQLLTPLSGCEITDWSHIATVKNREIDDARKEIDKWTTIIGGTMQKIARAEADLLTLRSEYKEFAKDADAKTDGLSAEMESLEQRLSAANARMDDLKKRRRMIAGAIETLGAKLAGTITCPACRHEFLVSDDGFDVGVAKTELEDNRVVLDSIDGSLLDGEAEAEKAGHMKAYIRDESRTLSVLREQWKDRLAKGERAVQAAEYELEGNKFNLKRIQDFVAGRTREVEDIRRSLFDEAYDIIDDAKKKVERTIARHREHVSAANSSIETLQQTITELENSSGSELIASLKGSLNACRKRSAEALGRKSALESQVNTLITQIQIFSQFRTHLANMKINALGAMMNRVLADLGSDLRINLSGYTQLKSGAIREKISVSITRDGIDIGSFGKCSAGEAARVNLASLLAMQRLVNGNTGFGKGLDLLVLDEILDAVDESGLASVFEALKKLNSTTLIVSHGLVAEGYPHKLLITKNNGESRIDYGQA